MCLTYCCMKIFSEQRGATAKEFFLKKIILRDSITIDISLHGTLYVFIDQWM